jgi:DNA-binding PadR family transcriptional regulator
MYALTVMEREGPVHGYGLSERIADRTEGAWRPGPGAVYPALQKLVVAGYARPKSEGRRRVYAITRKGRAALDDIRHRTGGMRGAHHDLDGLWAEVMGAEGVDGLLLLRLRRTVDAVEAYLARGGSSPGRTEAFRESVVAELAQAAERVRGTVPPPAARPKVVTHGH